MEFDRLCCGGNENPLGTGYRIVLSWNYALDGGRNEKQEAFAVTVSSEHETYDSERISRKAKTAFPCGSAAAMTAAFQDTDTGIPEKKDAGVFCI